LRLPVVSGHPAVCHAVLANLISNALKFVPPGVPPRVTVFAEAEQGWERVCVMDNGIGISARDREKIFGVFQRLHSNEEYPGTGIGLAIVARGVERMGGHFGLESGVGQVPEGRLNRRSLHPPLQDLAPFHSQPGSLLPGYSHSFLRN
jgi:signal transduction histidine kinase